jgi:hypothetical protein
VGSALGSGLSLPGIKPLDKVLGVHEEAGKRCSRDTRSSPR